MSLSKFIFQLHDQRFKFSGFDVYTTNANYLIKYSTRSNVYIVTVFCSSYSYAGFVAISFVAHYANQCPAEAQLLAAFAVTL